MTVNRTKTYIAADFDHDKDAVDILHEWRKDVGKDFYFEDAHELQTSNDDSLNCSIKASLKYRMDYSKLFVLIVGNHTKTVTKGGCQLCASYNSYSRSCARKRSVDYRSFIQYECDKAMEAGIKIIVLYKDTIINRNLCPEQIKLVGTHVAMITEGINGRLYWNYDAVKNAFNK